MSSSKCVDREFVPRRHPRLQTFSFIEICKQDGTPLMEATIREISSKGAQLKLSGAQKLPDRFIIRSEHDRSQIRATLIWQSDASIGVEFEDEF